MSEQLATDPQAIARAAALLERDDGLVIFPTETMYGIAARADRPQALRRLMKLKGRADKKSLPLIAASFEVVRAWATLPPALAELASRHWPGPLTLALKPTRPVDPTLTTADGTIGIRVSSHPVAQALAQAAGGVITATSANFAGAFSAAHPSDLNPQLKAGVDAWIDGGRCAGGSPSTIVGWHDGKLVVLREGAIASAKLMG